MRTYNMTLETEESLEPLSVKRALALLLLSIAIVVLSSQYTNRRIEVKKITLPSTQLRTIESQVDAAALPYFVPKQAPVAQPKPKEAPKPVEPPKTPVVQTEVAKATPTATKLEPTPIAQPAPVVVQKVPQSGAKAFIYQHESNNNPHAVNKGSGSCGLGQALPCSKMPCGLSDYNCQDRYFTKYMQDRYGSWEEARTFWQAHHWW